MVPKYNHSVCNLGTEYRKWSRELQLIIDQAINMIDPNSPAGQVLNDPTVGTKKQRAQNFFPNSQIHVGTDLKGKWYVNFVFHEFGNRSQPGKCHLYEDGSYTTTNGDKYPGYPRGWVYEPAPKKQEVP